MYSLRHAASCRTWSPSIIIRPNSTPTCRAAIKSCILLVLRRLHIITANKEIAQGSLPSRSDVDKRPSLLRRDDTSVSSSSSEASSTSRVVSFNPITDRLTYESAAMLRSSGRSYPRTLRTLEPLRDSQRGHPREARRSLRCRVGKNSDRLGVVFEVR
ncbi:hypothetical protein FOL46_005694 [Perkinsus olseni]|uniref:Uncharacterized protein n=1 Tax=Perkinsus olseni TaxID=32597 RepID=A0A7J6MS48_PEROL|nr:hypothetical protein FOL46_005694 [Perkinsus olseni]